MCIRDRDKAAKINIINANVRNAQTGDYYYNPVSYTHLALKYGKLNCIYKNLRRMTTCLYHLKTQLQTVVW